MHPKADAPTAVIPIVPQPPPRRPGRVKWLVTALVVALAVGGATVAVTRHRAGHREPVAEESAQVETVPLARRDLSTTKKLDGSIGFGPPRPLAGHTEATVTWLPAVGTTIKRGQQLFRADDKPVTLFYGNMPLYRAIAAPNQIGRDIRIIAENLKSLGYAIGRQPSPGESVTPAAATAGDTAPTTAGDTPPSTDEATSPGAGATQAKVKAKVKVKVKDGESVLTPALIKAIKKWQEAIGRPITGRIAVGDVEVLAGAIRVDSIAVQPGSPANAPLMAVTPTRKVITVAAALSEAAALRRGDRVTVTLPDDRTVKARILAVGRDLAAPEGGVAAGEPKLTVSVTVDDPKTIDRLDAADVAVNVTGRTAEDVLAVPIEALIALSEGGYAVQGPNGLVAVVTGMFADGFVEVTGAGLTEGMPVVVAS